MISLIFGTIRVKKNRNAEEYREQFPRAADAIIAHHYVDDLVICFTAEEEDMEICKQILEVHGYGGFKLRNFFWNSDTLQSVMNGYLQNQLSSEKVLGMYWNTQQDVFQYETKFHRIPKEVIYGDRVPTKRELLSIVMAIFNPFGLIADPPKFLYRLHGAMVQIGVTLDQQSYIKVGTTGYQNCVICTILKFCEYTRQMAFYTSRIE